MSRPGVTLREAREAYEKIKARGQHPSAQRLKDEIGSGSMTTLNAHLQILRAEDESKRSLEDLEKVSPELVKTVMKLHGQLQAVASTEVAKAQQQFEQQLKVAEDAKAELQAKLDASLAQIGRLEQDLVVARSMYDAEREALVASREQVGELSSQVKEKVEVIADLKSRLQVAQEETRKANTQLEHYQTAMAEERKRDKAEHAHAIASMQAKNESLNRDVVAKTELISQAGIRVASLENDLVSALAANTELRAAQAHLNELVAQREKTIDSLRGKLELAGEQERVAIREAKQSNVALAESSQKLAVAEVRLSYLEAENADLKTEMTKLRQEHAAANDKTKG